MFLPQVIQLYRSKKTEGLSLITFADFNIFYRILQKKS
ncbi:MAG: hypothetical protein LBU51_06325 [Bacteroidales bacterium]|nr:hypothetical protein [Bacteroidales bacterium]